MTHVESIDDESFEREVLASSEPFLLDFSAVWCAPCRVLEPMLEQLAHDQRGRLRVGKIDIDSSPLIAARLGVRGAPTLVLFEGGQERARQLGLPSQRALLKLVGADAADSASVARPAP